MKTKMFQSMRRFGLIALAGLLALVGSSAVSSGVVQAGPPIPLFTVNSAADKPDALPGDGKCETAGVKKKCTLRAAVMEANASPGAHEIRLGKHVYKFKRLGTDDTAALGDLDITSEIEIFGQSPNSTVIDAQKGDRIFDVRTGGDLTLSSMTLLNGATGGSGGGINVSGGHLAVLYSAIKNNSAAAGGAIAVASSGSAHVLGSQIESSIAYAGGGIYNQGQFVLAYSDVYDNLANYGGGISTGGTFDGIASTIAKNRANIDGGGILSAQDSGNLTGLWNMTISKNAADDNKSGDGNGGGIYINSGANVVSANSIIAGNSDGTPGAPTPTSKPQDCGGVIVSHGYNLLGNNFGCSGLANGVKGDKVGSAGNVLDAKLGALGLNGGQSLNYPLLATSPAIDGGDPADCVYGGQLLSFPVDQRGYWRYTDGGSGIPRCDIGSYEYKATSVEDCYNSKPAAPQLTLPKNNATVTDSVVLLDWGIPRCAFYFKVVVRQDTKKGTKVVDAEAGSSQFTTPALTKGHTYFWRVTACSTDTKCQNSKWFSFQLE